MKKILLVCGSGIITSTIVKKKLIEELDAKGYKDSYSITQARVEEVTEISKDYDLCVTTTLLGNECHCPVVVATNFLMGRNTEELIAEIISHLN